MTGRDISSLLLSRMTVRISQGRANRRSVGRSHQTRVQRPAVVHFGPRRGGAPQRVRGTLGHACRTCVRAAASGGLACNLNIVNLAYFVLFSIYMYSLDESLSMLVSRSFVVSLSVYIYIIYIYIYIL